MILVSNFCYIPQGDYERKILCLFLFVFSGVANVGGIAAVASAFRLLENGLKIKS